MGSAPARTLRPQDRHLAARPRATYPEFCPLPWWRQGIIRFSLNPDAVVQTPPGDRSLEREMGVAGEAELNACGVQPSHWRAAFGTPHLPSRPCSPSNRNRYCCLLVGSWWWPLLARRLAARLPSTALAWWLGGSCCAWLPFAPNLRPDAELIFNAFLRLEVFERPSTSPGQRCAREPAGGGSPWPTLGVGTSPSGSHAWNALLGPLELAGGPASRLC